ncbi:hypothetical protein E2C01_010466 [Portunus trituberculatus]|uniref:Uncharacterized protein n=1 Tax=Portunus trituberculatus TaxID=210409 RepID=A0A5B7D8Q5_PORTR|nr:hypothetical protein [Portunus trituberculatus]
MNAVGRRRVRCGRKRDEVRCLGDGVRGKRMVLFKVLMSRLAAHPPPAPGSPQPHLASRYKRREGVCVSLIALPLPGRFSPQKTQTYRARDVFVLAVCRRRVGGPGGGDGAQVPALSHCSKLVSAVSGAIS